MAAHADSLHDIEGIILRPRAATASATPLGQGDHDPPRAPLRIPDTALANRLCESKPYAKSQVFQ